MQKTLIEFRNNESVKILELNCDFDFRRRLCALGLYVGAFATILKNDNFSPIILKIFNSKVALSRLEAQRILAMAV